MALRLAAPALKIRRRRIREERGLAQQPLMVFGGEQRLEHGHADQVQLAARKQAQDRRVSARRSGGSHAPYGVAFGIAEAAGEVGEDRGVA